VGVGKAERVKKGILDERNIISKSKLTRRTEGQYYILDLKCLPMEHVLRALLPGYGTIGTW
jgi:hypothetical protein